MMSHGLVQLCVAGQVLWGHDSRDEAKVRLTAAQPRLGNQPRQLKLGGLS